MSVAKKKSIPFMEMLFITARKHAIKRKFQLIIMKSICQFALMEMTLEQIFMITAKLKWPITIRLLYPTVS